MGTPSVPLSRRNGKLRREAEYQRSAEVGVDTGRARKANSAAGRSCPRTAGPVADWSIA